VLDPDRVIERSCSDSIKWNRYGADVLPLWVADMDFGSPEPVICALRDRVEHGIFGYCGEPSALREVVLERLERLYGWKVAAESLLFVPGVVRGFNLACHAVGQPGDGVLAQTPVYYPMLGAPGNARRTLDQMELSRDERGYYTVDDALMESAVSPHTRLFMLCNPHNPVGRVFRRAELERMADICLRHNMVICSDEIHCELLFAGERHIPIATLSPEVERNTITLMAPSKTFNIAGLHCSVAIITDAMLRAKFLGAYQGLVSSVGIMGYVAALAAYRQGDPWLQEVMAYLEGNRDFLFDYVTARLPGVRTVKPEGTYLAWLDCREARLPQEPDAFFLERARVALNSGAAFGRGGEGFARLNFACRRAMLVEALERMRCALESL
jgi:cystathionine beta-lyase